MRPRLERHVVQAELGDEPLPARDRLGAASTPTKLAPGSASAIGTRLPPSPQPSSSTRQRAGGAGRSPNSVASVARRSGCVCANGCPG